ncbi:peroxiredoxin family protein [Saccharospirillum impatiens]|uniref:peroxiredoxin family protein n=1 Tax=Saccharospirillum impatiens TaxID=169438 RepID=UPI00040F861A|nr:redoxin domain-containing protein [Saccharospirillum impatiens]
MRIQAPRAIIDFNKNDIYGNLIQLSQFKGKKVLLCFFRDAACPFCNFRVYELTHRYKAWQKQNVEVIAVFSSTDEEVRHFVGRHPRPFRMVADPDLEIYNSYGVEHSSFALVKALLFKLPRIFMGMKTGGYPANNPNVKLVPADFLINEKGHIADCWYGRDTSDHIPLKRLQAFIDSPPKTGLDATRARAA